LSFKPFMLMLSVLWILSCVVFLLAFFLVDLGTYLLLNKEFSFEFYKSIDYFKDKIWIPLAIPPFFALLMNYINNSLQKKSTVIQMNRPIETPDEYEELFKKEIKKYKIENVNFKKMVVIIDDLDRLSPRKVVDALDAIKAFVDVEECIFIVSCDEQILKKALEKQRLAKTFEEIDGELFLDKLFQFRIPLPPIIESDMKEYSRNLALQEVPDLVNMCNGKFNEIINILIHPAVTTPRQVKKLLNTFANNLLIAKKREGRKLENNLLTGEKGIKILAKLSVLQSDYSDVYNGLLNNYKLLDEILGFYNGEEITNEVTISYFNKKNNKIKDEYEGLINFLLRTQHITTENIGPFLYLGQGSVGLLAGDENERHLRKNLLGANERGIIPLLQSNKADTIANAIIEQIKLTSNEDLMYVLKAGYQLISYIPDNIKRNFADTISYRIQEIPLERALLWQIDTKNLVEMYFYAENKSGVKKALLYVMENLFDSKEWKTKDNKEMDSEDYIVTIYEIIDFLLLKDEEMNDQDISKMIRQFIANRNSEYDFFPINKIQQLYRDHQSLFDKYFGLSFFYQLATHIVDNSKDKNVLNRFNSTLFSIIPIVKEKYRSEFLEYIPTLFSINKEITLKLIKIVLSDIDQFTEDSSIEILESIFKNGFDHDDDVLELLKFLEKLKLSKITEDEESLNKFDEFMHSIFPVPGQDKDEDIKIFNKLLNDVVSRLDNGFKKFPKLFSYILDEVMNSPSYDDILKLNNGLFGDDQRSLLFEKIKTGITFGNVDINTFNRTYTLYTILINNKTNEPYIISSLAPNFTYFNNNQFVNYPVWAEHFIKMLRITKELVNAQHLNTMVRKILEVSKNNSSFINLLIKSLSYLDNVLSDEIKEAAIPVIYNKTDIDTTKLDALEFFRTVRGKNISSEKGNLGPYAQFLVDNVEINPDQFINDLYWFTKISSSKFVTLMKKINNLPDILDTDTLSVIRRTVGKLFKALNQEEKTDLLFEIFEEVDVKVINNVLLDQLNDKKELLTELIVGMRNKDNKLKIKMLEVIGKYQEGLSLKLIAEAYSYILSSVEQDQVSDVYDLSMEYFRNFRFNRSRSMVYVEVLRLFKRVNNDLKVIVLQLAKNFGMEKDFKEERKSGDLSNEEIIIIKSEYQIR
jgi:hypothetical protein